MKCEPGQTLFLEVRVTVSVVTCVMTAVWFGHYWMAGKHQVGQGLCRMTQSTTCSSTRTVVHGFINHHVCHH